LRGHHTAQRKAAYDATQIARTLDKQRKTEGFNQGCKARTFSDINTSIKDATAATASIKKFAKVPKTPPKHAPSERIFCFDEYTAKTAMATCDTEIQNATVHFFD
jgi:hypothetical protein